MIILVLFLIFLVVLPFIQTLKTRKYENASGILIHGDSLMLPQGNKYKRKYDGKQNVTVQYVQRKFARFYEDLKLPTNNQKYELVYVDLSLSHSLHVHPSKAYSLTKARQNACDPLPAIFLEEYVEAALIHLEKIANFVIFMTIHHVCDNVFVGKWGTKLHLMPRHVMLQDCSIFIQNLNISSLLPTDQQIPGAQHWKGHYGSLTNATNAYRLCEENLFTSEGSKIQADRLQSVLQKHITGIDLNGNFSPLAGRLGVVNGYQITHDSGCKSTNDGMHYADTVIDNEVTELERVYESLTRNS